MTKPEQQKIIEIERKKKRTRKKQTETFKTFRENLEMLKMNLKVYDKKEE